MNWPTITAVVLNWNNYEDTSRILENMKGHEYPKLDIIIVDNFSTDGSFERLKNEYDNKILRNDSNRGFAGGCNSGITKAIEDSSDYILLVNNDVKMASDTLFQLVEVLESNRDGGIVGPKIVSPDGTIDDGGREFNGRKLIFSILDKGKGRGEINGIRQVDAVSGCCMLIDTDLVRDIGLLDESRFFFGGEDFDYCRRARNAGWDIYVQNDTNIIHKGGSTSSSHSRFLKYHYTRNKLNLWKKQTNKRFVGLTYRFIRDFLYIFILYFLLRCGEANAMIKAYMDVIQNNNPRRTEYLDM